jgi:hypothetical protein
MPIPDYQTLMLPLLKLAGDAAVHSKRDTVPEPLRRQAVRLGTRRRPSSAVSDPGVPQPMTIRAYRLLNQANGSGRLPLSFFVGIESDGI